MQKTPEISQSVNLVKLLLSMGDITYTILY